MWGRQINKTGQKFYKIITAYNPYKYNVGLNIENGEYGMSIATVDNLCHFMYLTGRIHSVEIPDDAMVIEKNKALHTNKLIVPDNGYDFADFPEWKNYIFCQDTVNISEGNIKYVSNSHFMRHYLEEHKKRIPYIMNMLYPWEQSVLLCHVAVSIDKRNIGFIKSHKILSPYK